MIVICSSILAKVFQIKLKLIKIVTHCWKKIFKMSYKFQNMSTFLELNTEC